MKKSIKKELTKYLKQSNHADLVKEIKMLYDKFPTVKKYYEMEFSSDTTGVVKEFKKQIRKEYFPTRGFGKARNNVSRKVITEFKKISNYPIDVIDLILFRVEMMLEFTNTYGDIDEAFYNSLTRSFDEACQLIANERLEEKFKDQCEALIYESGGIGWGLSDAMNYSFEQVM